MSETEWRRLRADQLRERAQEDAIVILPIASLEQHGPHLPVEVDSLLGETVAARTAAKLAARNHPVVVLPVLWTGLSEHHMSFGGTITLDNAAFAALIEGVVRSILRPSRDPVRAGDPDRDPDWPVRAGRPVGRRVAGRVVSRTA